ncbi:MAG: DUF58 domain-containing protein [Anaerolineae bacterium]|nr:DUF58 domain-containing protein [Anaerolineae bacterium]
MPARRVWGFLILAIGLYFLANQTQVGWLYVLVDGIIGLLIASFFYSRGMLTPIRAKRIFQNLADGQPETNPQAGQNPNNGQTHASDLAPPTFHEDDPVRVILQFSNIGFRPAFLIRGEEVCPFAPPADQIQPLFVPNLFNQQPVRLSYQTTCDRRGLHAFPKLRLQSKGPFGFFSTRRLLDAPDEILIYPYYHPLKRLRLLETRELAERQTARVGLGTQVVSTREYRPGDSLRQIHWRSTARAGKLIVKEFAQEDQPSLTVVLDLETASSVGQGKFSTFETAIRLAASLGYYATQHDVPFRLAGTSLKWTPPATPLSWWGTLNYLAKVQNDGQEPLAKVIQELPAWPFVVVLISNPNIALARALTTLPPKGTQTLAIFITPTGALPEEFRVSKITGLEIRRVSPYNWAEVVEEL